MAELNLHPDHPDFLDLEWDRPLEDWDTERLIDLPKGISRHEVRFVSYPEGIYAVRGVLRDGTYTGALHMGPRPTFKGSPPSVELHLLDFDRDIYGEEVRVDFIERLLRCHVE